MDWNAEAKQAQMRAVAVYAARPALARETVHGSAELRDGFTCVYEQDGQRVVADMPAVLGGSGRGPTPGFYGRAGLCTCLAIGIRLTAVREGLHIDAVRVRIEQDWDDRGMFAMGDAPAAPIDTRLFIEIDSPEAAHRIEPLVNMALAHDPWFLAYREAQPVSTALAVNPAGA